MTVKELFEHFRCLFAKIVYFDETDNIEEVIYIEDMYGMYNSELQEDFIEEYGDYEVVEWEYRYQLEDDNRIDLTISRKEE